MNLRLKSLNDGINIWPEAYNWPSFVIMLRVVEVQIVSSTHKKQLVQ
jgi:hypothetical protein